MERPGRWATHHKETTYEPEPSGSLFLDPAVLTNARDVFPSSWRMPFGSRRRWREWLCIKRVFVMAQCLWGELLFGMRWFAGVQECLDWECFTERILAGLRKKEDILPRMRLTRRTKKVCCLSAFPFISMQLLSCLTAKTSLEIHNWNLPSLLKGERKFWSQSYNL